MQREVTEGMTHRHENDTPGVPVRGRHWSVALDDVESSILNSQVQEDTEDRSADGDNEIKELVAATGRLIVQH